jgi:hypothetical protein
MMPKAGGGSSGYDEALTQRNESVSRNWASPAGLLLKRMDEKKPTHVSGLNPYQEETWRRQKPLYTTGWCDAMFF